MWEQIEVLKDSADFESQILDATAVVGRRQSGLETHAIALDRAAIDRLESVETTQQRRLTAARCADHAEYALRRHFKTNPLQDFVTAETLAQVSDANHAVTSSTRSVARVLRRRSSIRARCAIGKLIAR